VVGLCYRVVGQFLSSFLKRRVRIFSSSSLVLLDGCDVSHIMFFCNLILNLALGLLGCAFDMHLFAAHLAPHWIYPVVFILPLMRKFIMVVLPF
jgi:hypothetical protein